MNNNNLSYNLKQSQAIIIGTSHYADGSGYSDLIAVENNVDKLFQIFSDSKILGIPKNSIKVFKDSENPTEIYQSITNIESRLDLFILYYSGHGSLNQTNNKDLLLTLSNTKIKDTSFSSLEYSKIKSSITKVKAKIKLVIIDSCFSGNATTLMSEGIQQLTEIEGAVVISSTEANQLALGETKHSKFTAFTSLLIDVLENGIPEEIKTLSLEKIISNIASEANSKKYPTPKLITTTDISKINFCYNLFQFRTQLSKSLSRKKQLLLVKTKSAYPVKNYDFGVPLGLYVLKSYLRRYGYNVDIFDERLNQLKNINTSFEEMVLDYDVVGITICSTELPTAINYFRKAKELGKTTVAGGIFAYSNEDYLLSYPEIDYVIPGVATRPLQQLLLRLSERKEDKIIDIKGVYCSVEGAKSNWQNIDPIWSPDTVPFIDKPVLEEIIYEYRDFLNAKFDLITARGCYFRCDFCSIQKECSRQPRTRNVANVIENIEYLANTGFKLISLKDEIFPLEISRSNYILDKVQDTVEQNDVNFKIKSRIDIIRREDKLLDYFADRNVKEIQYGVESLNQQMLLMIHKNTKYDENDLKDFFKKHEDLGITVNASFILGIDGEHEDYYDYLVNTLDKLNSENLKVYVNFYTPHPFKGKWNISGEAKLLLSNLDYFTHKIPVLVPSTISTRNQKIKMVDTYNAISKLTNSQNYNPVIPSHIKDEFIYAHRDLKNIEIPRY